MLAAAILVIAQAAAPAAAHRFSPPLDSDWRYRIDETREQDGRTDRYRLERTVRFKRAERGFTAVLTVTAVDGGIASGPGAMFEAGMSGFVGVPIQMHLDPAGRVTAVDDLDRHFDRWTDGIVAIGLRGVNADKRAPIAKALADRFAAMPTPARLDMFASMLGAIIPTPDLPAAPVAETPIDQKSAAADLSGTRRAFRSADDWLVIDDRLTGQGRSPQGAFDLSVEHRRTIDPATGLIRSAVRVRRTASGDAAQVTTTRITVDPPPAN
ncbi:hypothetical protein ACNI3Q_13295 [Sphingomonas sp. FW199]|uniref:hypothetical protein n=1 Tax=Sphingomonas sp. FW199 TaxID=3400217 RepID=UPI003CF82C45